MNSISAATSVRPANCDRELLELAAKAAGISLRWERDPSMPFQERWQAMTPCGWVGQPSEREWNPLREDGDALPLAVKLRIAVEFDPGYAEDACAYAFAGGRNFAELLKGDHNADHGAATRRAIVRAAAEIGRARPI